MKNMLLELLIENMNEEDFDPFFDEVVQLVEKYNAFCGGSFMPYIDKNNGPQFTVSTILHKIRKFAEDVKIK